MITLKQAGQWSWLVKIIALAGLSLTIILLGYWFIIQDNFAQYERLKAQELSLKTDFEGKQKQVVNLVEYRRQFHLMNKRFRSMLKQLPAQNELPALLAELSKTGIASGLKFELFAPQPEVAHDFYVALPIKLSMVGNYFQFALFFSRVAQMNRMVTWHELSIEGGAVKEGNAALTDQLVMNITAKIYRYRTL